MPCCLADKAYVFVRACLPQTMNVLWTKRLLKIWNSQRMWLRRQPLPHPKRRKLLRALKPSSIGCPSIRAAYFKSGYRCA